MTTFYNILVNIAKVLVKPAAVFSPKARLWIEGQGRWKGLLKEKITASDKVLWIHCSSLGEFEQGRPVIEEIRRLRPGLKILLTFFSPSGYEVRKNYRDADCVCYLPADTPGNAASFLDIAHPSAAIFVKYEFWNNYISGLYERSIPFYLISAIFRPGQHFFRWYGSFFRRMLRKFDMIYVQDQRSVELLSGIGIKKVVRAGDTRFDRVMQIAASSRDIPQLSSFKNGEKLFLAGSSWKADEEIISRYINNYPGRMKWVFAPHEVNEENVSRLEKLFSVSTVRYSQYTDAAAGSRVMIIDNIGMLSSAYRYAFIAAVGGGFGKGIHNILEPASWGIPVLFGPRHEKFREANELLKLNGAMCFNSFGSFCEIIDKLLDDEAFYLKSGKSASDYVSKNTGATRILLDEIIHRI